MSLIFTSLIYFLVFFILTAKELITENYDHDIDQFMYFGGRLLHGELIWTNEFDDKSPVLQYIFSLPAAFKSTSIFVFITLVISLVASYLGYMMLKNIIQNSKLELNKKDEDSILLFGAILYLTLLVCIYGSLHHINALSSSLCLITIVLLYFRNKNNNKSLLHIAAITAAISISIRPYYLPNIIIIPLWLEIREGMLMGSLNAVSIIKTSLEYIKKQINWIIIISLYIIVFNLTPYLLTGQITDFIYGIKLNTADYVNHNVLERQYINLGRNPILYPAIISMILLPFIRILFSNHIIKYDQYEQKSRQAENKIDVDIVFFGIINPILLEIMFFKKHFFGHYFTLFSPYILICMVLFLAITTRIDKKIYRFRNLRIAIKIIFTMLLIVCLITNQSITKAATEIFNTNVSEKLYKVHLVKEFIEKEKPKNGNLEFLAPEDNYLHWKLDESRHGFPQKAIFRNISNGKMDKLISENVNLDYKFLLPNRIKLCDTLNNNAPEYIITKKNDYSFNCLKQKTSKYKLLSTNKELKKNNMFIFKRNYE